MALSHRSSLDDLRQAALAISGMQGPPSRVAVPGSTTLVSRRARGPSVLLTFVFYLAAGGEAEALSLDPATLPFSAHGGGQIHVLGIVEGLPANAAVLAGSVSPTAQTILFEIERAVDPLGDPDSLTMASIQSGPDLFASPRNMPVGAGWIPREGVDPPQVQLNTSPGWSFLLDAPLAPGQRSDILLGSFDHLVPGDLTVFSVPTCSDPTGSGTVLCSGLVVSGVVVPEPATFFLVSAGCIALGLRGAALQLRS
jgi:hypothetical protein